jgi:hypothetical protein
MNDARLNQLLRAVPVPGRKDAYWEDFPARTRIRARAARLALRGPEPDRERFVRLAWIGGLAFVGALALFVWTGVTEWRTIDTPAFRHDLVQLPANLRTVMEPDHGQKKLLLDQP